MKKIFSFNLCLIIIMSLIIPAGAGDVKQLKFNDNGEFKILVLSDTQDDRYPSYDMINLVKESIVRTKPDLIVFTGDLIEDKRIGDLGTDSRDFKEGVNVKNTDGSINHEKTLENIKIAADNVLSVFESYKIPFAIAMGNNDYKCTVTSDEWLDIFSHYSYCLATDTGIKADNRNDYNIFIYGNDGSVKFNLWLLDTGRGGLNDEQTEWYKSQSKSITENNGGTVIPAFAFQHIQPDDVGNLFEYCKISDKGATLCNGKYVRLKRDIATGYNTFGYLPCEPTAEFKAFKKCKDVIGIYFGHQHSDGFTGKYDGIEMGFNYGAEFAKAGPYGYRVITLYENDILNYDNDIYTYEGSVITNNVKIKKQTDVKDTSIVKRYYDLISLYIKKFFTMIICWFG